jgi:hypothetical protein
MKKYLLYNLIFFFITILSVHIFQSATPIVSLEKQHGVCWVAMPHPVEKSDFLPLVENNIQWINQTPFAFQKEYNSPEIKFFTNEYVWWGERDIGIETTTAMARELGIKTILKPHIWLHSDRSGKWRSEIEMDDETGWQQWFSNYENFILHHALLAEKNQVEIFCIGTELHKTVRKRETDWRNLIARVKQVYRGKITYAANWHQEFEEVPFWDELDYIGIQAYFPLSEEVNPSVDLLMQGWKPYLEKIEKIQKKYQRPVLFTEIGYRNGPDAASHPWKWENSHQPEETGFQVQANCYEAFFRTFWHKEWFAGVYFWKWFPNLEKVPHYEEKDFTPQQRPAEKILAKWFNKK